MTHRVRVFHLIKGLGRGGAEMLLAEGLRFADRQRFDYAYGYLLPWKNAVVPCLTAAGAEVTCFRAGTNVAIALSPGRIAAHLRKLGVHVLHCHLPIAGVVGRVAGRLAGVPVVYTEHNAMERYRRVTRRLNLLTWAWQDRVIAVSQGVADSIRGRVGTRALVEVIQNGVDTDRFRRNGSDGEHVRDELGIPTAAPVIGTVAVFREQKRLQDWLAAAWLLGERHPDAHFILVGDGPLRDSIGRLVNTLGLGNIVHLPGLREDVRPYLAAMDVYLISSQFEGLPVALLEAMAMECAVVATAVGGIPEVLGAGDCGMLVEPGRPDRLAAAVSNLLTGGTSLRARGQSARCIVEARFSLGQMVRRVEATYAEVVEQHRYAG
jgi:glycosyltransferase involved in cell wall biosynthesis